MSHDRRDFLKAAIPAGALMCLGCKGALAAGKKPAKKPAHKFQQQADMTYEQVFQFAFLTNTLPMMKELSRQVGEKKFLGMVKKAVDAAMMNQFGPMAEKWPKRDLPTFRDWVVGMMEEGSFMKRVLNFRFEKKTDSEFSMKVTECLWAKTFRQAQAGELGYAMVCHGDFAVATAINPKIKMIRTKTLMQGHDCCDHRYVWEG